MPIHRSQSRLAIGLPQLILEKVLVLNPDQSHVDSTTVRGSHGFGSTGTGPKRAEPVAGAVAAPAALQGVQAAIAAVDAVFKETWDYYEGMEAKTAEEIVAGQVKAAAALEKDRQGNTTHAEAQGTRQTCDHWFHVAVNALRPRF